MIILPKIYTYNKNYQLIHSNKHLISSCGQNKYKYSCLTITDELVYCKGYHGFIRSENLIIW